MKRKIILFCMLILGVFLFGACSESTQKEQGNEEIKICTADWNPVCGVDGKTYANECNAGDVEIAYEGECKEVHVCTEEEKLNQICTREFDPVCGNDNKTYATGCTACSLGVESWTKGTCY